MLEFNSLLSVIETFRGQKIYVVSVAKNYKCMATPSVYQPAWRRRVTP